MVISTPVRSFSGQQSCQSRHYTDVLETEQPPPAKRGRVTPLGVHCGADVDFSEHDGSSETKQDVSTEAAVVTPVPPVTFTSTSTTGSGGRSRQPSPERAKVRLLEDHTGLCDHGGDRGVGMTPAAVFACVSPSQPSAGGMAQKHLYNRTTSTSRRIAVVVLCQMQKPLGSCRDAWGASPAPPSMFSWAVLIRQPCGRPRRRQCRRGTGGIFELQDVAASTRPFGDGRRRTRQI